MDQIWVVIILGIVEGLTEFIPVSSTGHLIWVGHLLNFKGVKAASFEVFIQMGAMLAVIILYRQRFQELLPFKSSPSDRIESRFTGQRGCCLLFLTAFPALLTGFLMRSLIINNLFKPMTVLLALVVGGIGILITEYLRPTWYVKGLDEITRKQAVIIGLFQCLSFWPGVSRAAATIIGGMLCGLDRKTAAEYSFIAAVPVLIIATIYDLYETWWLLQSSDILYFITGFIVSFLVALVVVKTFLGVVQRWTLRPFAWYRIAITPVIYWLMR